MKDDHGLPTWEARELYRDAYQGSWLAENAVLIAYLLGFLSAAGISILLGAW